MDEEFRKLQERIDRGWAGMLKTGREHLGNIEVNKQFLREVGLINADSRVLEVGCGVGAIVYELSGIGCDITGTDISSCAIEYGQKKYPGIKLEVQAAEVLNYPDESFDIVLSFDLLEHLHVVDRHLSQVHRLLRPGGYYLLQTPNKYCNMVFETLKTRSLKWRNYHPSLHSAAGLKRRFRNNDFDIRFVKMNTINKFTLKKFDMFGKLFFWVRYINFLTLPLFMQTNFYVVAKKS